MKILQINSASGFGGGEKHLLDLTFCLQTRGHEIFVALRPNAIWRERLNFVSDQHILRLSLSNALDLHSVWQLAEFIKENRIKIVHAHLARDYSLAALAVRLSKTAAKLVLTRHVLFPLKRWHKFVLPRNTNFIAVSNAVRESLLRRKILPPQAIKLIYNGIDTRHFASVKRTFNRSGFLEKLQLSPTRRYVGIVGEITAHKGQTDFVRAATMIAEKHGDVDFLIVGDDNSRGGNHRRELEKQIIESNLSKRVYLTSWLTDVAPALCALEVFVSASRVEPFGLAIVEAMATGLPVVATRSDGAQEILTDGETGKLIEIGNSSIMAAAIDEFLNNEAARRDFGKKAQTAAREKFDLALMTAQTEQLYLEILDGNQRSKSCLKF